MCIYIRTSLQRLIIQYPSTLIHPKGSINKNLGYPHLLGLGVTNPSQMGPWGCGTQLQRDGMGSSYQ